MSIDARVAEVRRRPDGSGAIYLIDNRPASIFDSPGIVGHGSLGFSDSPSDVSALTGQYIWGGDSKIMLGHKQIATLEGYTGIRFIVDSIVNVIKRETTSIVPVEFVPILERFAEENK